MGKPLVDTKEGPPAEQAAGTLALDRETMRELGYRTVDMLVDRLADETVPPLRRGSPAEMASRLGGPAPVDPESFDEILARLRDDVLAFTSRLDHPGFFAFIPSAGTWPSALGDFVASACNIFAGSWMESAGPSQVELEVLGWFKHWVGFPESASGTLLTGGSAANMSAMACAREQLAGPMSDRLVIYLSDQSHSSLARAARVLGFRPDQVRVLPTDTSLRLRPEALAAVMDADLRAGRRPLFLAANAGATNAGTVDPLPELAELCRERGVWFHVDGAYGGFAVLTERGRAQLSGIELADSLALDPHKWLYQPYECGCLLVRKGHALRAAFEITPDYLNDAKAAQAEVDFADLGLQLSRASRALKVWVSLRYFGLAAFRSAIDRSLDLTEFARARIDESESLELAVPPSLGVVCLRRRFADSAGAAESERRNAALVAELERSGLGLASTTRLHGEHAIRLCVLNHTTQAENVERVLSFLESADVDRDAVPGPGGERERDISDSWVVPEQGGDASVALVSLFHGLSPDDLRTVQEAGSTRRAVDGEVVVAEFETSNDLYVILEGSAEVLIRGEHQAELHEGDFFGELAALDWGAGYSYSRTATVRATSNMRLLVISADKLRLLMEELPVIDARIRTGVRQHLRRT